MGSREEKIVEHAKSKSLNRQKEVLDAISMMVKRGDKISFYSVQKETGASKSYLYGNDAIRTCIEEARNRNKNNRTEESKEAIIKALKIKIKNLENELKTQQNENGESYKQKYELLLAENKELKQQLRNSYKY